MYGFSGDNPVSFVKNTEIATTSTAEFTQRRQQNLQQSCPPVTRLAKLHVILAACRTQRGPHKQSKTMTPPPPPPTSHPKATSPIRGNDSPQWRSMHRTLEHIRRSLILGFVKVLYHQDGKTEAKPVSGCHPYPSFSFLLSLSHTHTHTHTHTVGLPSFRSDSWPATTA